MRYRAIVLIACAAALQASAALATESYSSLDAAADDFAEDVSGALPTKISANQAIYVDELQSPGAPAFVEERATFRELFTSRLMGKKSISVIDGPGAAEKAT